MPVTVLFTDSAQKELSCCVPGCGKCAGKTAALEATAPGKLLFRFTCENGHTTMIELLVGAKIQDRMSEMTGTRPEHKMRAKISGVTFDNPDGTSRQNILRYVKQGDALQICQSEVGGNTAYIVRHALGVLGTIKKDIILTFCGGPPQTLPINATVVRVTGGDGDKETLGCNIELCAPQEEKPTATKSRRTMHDPRENMSVFIDRAGQNIFHLNQHCSGLKTAEMVSLRDAVVLLKARPCKKCAASLAEEERK